MSRFTMFLLAALITGAALVFSADRAAAQVAVTTYSAPATVTYVPVRRGILFPRIVYEPVVTPAATATATTTYYAPSAATTSTYYAPSAEVTTYFVPAPATRTYYSSTVPMTTSTATSTWYYSAAAPVVTSGVTTARPVPTYYLPSTTVVVP